MLQSNDGGATWSVRLQAQVNALDFLDRDTGWVASATTAGGHLFHTDDGGIHWRDDAAKVPGPTPLFFDIVAVDALQVVAVGSENGFLRPDDFHRGPPAIAVTDDGGVNWRRAEIENVNQPRVRDIALGSVCVLANGIGIATGTDTETFVDTLVLLTRNGGASWMDVTERIPTIVFAKVACLGTNDLWIVGGPHVLRSDDMGTTWTDIAPPLPAGTGVGAVHFDDTTSGWIAVEDTFGIPPLPGGPGHRLLALRTADGGRHWDEHVVATGLGELTLGAIDFLDDQRGILVVADLHPLNLDRSSFGLSFRTSDGGDTWTETVHPDPINALWDAELFP